VWTKWHHRQIADCQSGLPIQNELKILSAPDLFLVPPFLTTALSTQVDTVYLDGNDLLWDDFLHGGEYVFSGHCCPRFWHAIVIMLCEPLVGVQADY
jgi:hypothetical protein